MCIRDSIYRIRSSSLCLVRFVSNLESGRVTALQGDYLGLLYSIIIGRLNGNVAFDIFDAGTTQCICFDANLRSFHLIQFAVSARHRVLGGRVASADKSDGGDGEYRLSLIHIW